jgi:hypothetical protein
MTDPHSSQHNHVDNHLDVDTVADLIENLLPAGEAHRARDHVKACPDCQRTYDALIQLNADLAEEGRADIPMPADVADHLDSVIRSESVLRASTVGVHSLAQIREEPRRHLPRLLMAAAVVLVVGAVGAGIVVSTANQHEGSSAGLQEPSDSTPGQTSPIPTLTTAQIAGEVQRLVQGSTGAVIGGSAAERSCAADFASRQPNQRALRLVMPAQVEGRRSTVIGLQADASRDLRVFVVTGCDSRGATGSDANVVYVTSVTLRNG